MWYILRITTVYTIISLVTPVAIFSQSPIKSPVVTVTRVTRPAQDLVEIQYVVDNSSDSDIFLPTATIGDSVHVYTFRLWQATPTNGWIGLGPYYDLPAPASLQLKAGQSRVFIYRTYDPGVTMLTGEGIPIGKKREIPIRGSHKIEVGYYGSEADWLSYRTLVEHIGKPGAKKRAVPRLLSIESKKFEIPSEVTLGRVPQVPVLAIWVLGSHFSRLAK